MRFISIGQFNAESIRCLGTAVILRWNTVPTKLQKELFDCASSIGAVAYLFLAKGLLAGLPWSCAVL